DPGTQQARYTSNTPFPRHRSSLHVSLPNGRSCQAMRLSWQIPLPSSVREKPRPEGDTTCCQGDSTAGVSQGSLRIGGKRVSQESLRAKGLRGSGVQERGVDSEEEEGQFQSSP